MICATKKCIGSDGGGRGPGQVVTGGGGRRAVVGTLIFEVGKDKIAGAF